MQYFYLSLVLSRMELFSEIFNKRQLRCCNFFNCLLFVLLMGHPFMTSIRMGEVGSGSVGGGGVKPPCGRLHRKLQLESTDVILSSSHAKKLAAFLPFSSLDGIKSGNFRRY